VDLLYLGIILLITSLFVGAIGATQGLQWLSVGAIMIGLGGCSNHELRTVIDLVGAGAVRVQLVEKRLYKPRRAGIVLTIFGGLLIAIGAAAAVFSIVA
jgi:hypothetical protein